MLCIIGGGPVQGELEQQAKDLGIDSMVIFTGAVPHDQMPPYYASCDVYVTASLSDTNSISIAGRAWPPACLYCAGTTL